MAPQVKSTPVPPNLQLNELHLQRLATIQQFSLQGRIAVQTNDKGFSGRLSWQHQNNHDNITLFSPLGGQVASITKTPEQITLEDHRGNSISARDTESLTQPTLGWQLPLTGLADWTLGRPTNSAIIDSTWSESGQLLTLNQDGWKIEYQDYEISNHYMLPKKIILKSDRVNLKLLVEKWDVPGTQSTLLNH